MPNPDTMKNKHSYHTNALVGIPLISIDPSGLGSQYQIETT